MTETGNVDQQQAVSKKMCLACDRQFTGTFMNCPDDHTPLVPLPEEDNLIGQVLADRYYIMQKLGKGGMGIVYLAKHQMMDRLVAIKMLQAELSLDQVSVKRFQQEAKAASCLSHPHIIMLYDFGILPSGQPFLAMEYLQGVSLLDIIKKDGPLDPQRAVKIFAEVADGLHHAHIQGIVHRDLKPSNIILVNQDNDIEFVKVVDFGLAKLMPWSGKESQHLTRTGEVFGSPIYMSPEQCMGKTLGVQSDIYSLGVTLYEALMGKPPFKGKNSIHTAQKHMTEMPASFEAIRPDLYRLPEYSNLWLVVQKALEKNPENRFADMAEVKEALYACLNEDMQVAMPASLQSTSRAGIQAISPAQSLKSGTQVIKTDPAKGSSTADPKKSAVNNLRAVSTKPRIEAKHFLIGGGIIAAAAVAAFLWNFVLEQKIEQVEGVVTYYNPEAGEVEIDSGGKPMLFQIPEIGDTDLPSNEDTIGSKAHIDYQIKNNKPVAKSVKQVSGAPKEISLAKVVTREYLHAAKNGSDEHFLEGHATSNFRREWDQYFKKNLRPEIGKTGSLIAESKEFVAPVSSLRLAEMAETSLKLQLDGKVFFENPKKKFLTLTLKLGKGDPQISDGAFQD